jgi:hypothetical protein
LYVDQEGLDSPLKVRARFFLFVRQKGAQIDVIWCSQGGWKREIGCLLRSLCKNVQNARLDLYFRRYLSIIRRALQRYLALKSPLAPQSQPSAFDAV